MIFEYIDEADYWYSFYDWDGTINDCQRYSFLPEEVILEGFGEVNEGKNNAGWGRGSQ